MNDTPNGTPDLLAGLASLARADDLSVGKDGFNQHFNYGYMTEAALFTAARAALAEAGLSGTLSFEGGQHEVIPTFNKDGQERPGILATITAVLTLRDSTGNSIECRAYGQGLDPADKAYYKAMTGAAKYAVQKALMIAVESEDTDAGAGEQRAAGRAQGGGMTGVASEKQLGFLASLVKKSHLVDAGSDTAATEAMGLRLARMQGDSAATFAGISKKAASDLIEKLSITPAHRSGEVVQRLEEWEAEHGHATAEPAAPATPASDDDIPF